MRLKENRILSERNSFLILSFLAHTAFLTMLSYSPVKTRLAIPLSEIDMIDVEVKKPQSDEIKVETVPENELADEPAYIEKKVMPLPVKTSIYLPVYEVNTPPRIKRWIEPEYPDAYRRSGIESYVVVEIDVNADGGVVDTRVVKSGGAEFDSAALDAIKKSEFYPAFKNNRPVPVRVRLPVKFELE